VVRGIITGEHLFKGVWVNRREGVPEEHLGKRRAPFFTHSSHGFFAERGSFLSEQGFYIKNISGT